VIAHSMGNLLLQVLISASLPAGAVNRNHLGSPDVDRTCSRI
jgi:hypothetical protein